ncbi:MAG: DNA mismatch repair protein MutS [Dehalococcoidia bacterium]
MSTPIRRQYLELKARYPDTILFFRLGDFYETFDDDAKLVSRELSIVLTGKPMGKDLRVPLAGVPHHSIDGHVAKLVAKGYRVALCEQLADPAGVKGLVPRDVVRVVTSGTVTAEASLDPAAPNYLAAVGRVRDETAVALVDVTTGELRLASGGEALAELLRSAPAEVLAEDAADVPAAATGAFRHRPRLSDLAVEAKLASQFGPHIRATLALSACEALALALLLEYVGETYAAALGAIQRVQRVASGGTLALDQRTLRNLDVLPAPGKASSLVKVLDRCSTPMGSRRLRDWLTRPLRDGVAIGRRQAGIAWGLAHPIEREQCRALLRGVPDAARLLGKVGAKSASPRDLDALRRALGAALDLGRRFEHLDRPPIITESLQRLASCTEALLALDQVLADDPPADFDEGGVIRAGFSGELDSLRAMTQDARGFLLGLERIERERTGIRSLKVGHNRVFGYYIEVSTANAPLVPADYQRRQTLVGAERYVTEQLKEYESQLVGARDRLVELERQAFGALVATVGAQLGALQQVADGMATIDLLLALAEGAGASNYVAPRFAEDASVRITGGRHPVVEAALGPGRFVPNDCVLDDASQVLILTGPNMAGKSTFLRQVALIALMAQAGCFVPAVEATLPLFDRIFTRVGAQDDLAAGQSTFMVEMVETAQILHSATAESLVILDEVGRGTSTFDGMAIARAVVEFLHNRKEVAARTLFATHYHELTALADILPRVSNAHVAVHEADGEVAFEHRIVPGPSDRSYGIHVAKLAGLPAAVVSRAEHLLAELEEDGSKPSAGRRAPTRQPALFPVESEVEALLQTIDPDSLTPLEAMQRLYELRALLPGRGKRS